MSQRIYNITVALSSKGYWRPGLCISLCYLVMVHLKVTPIMRSDGVLSVDLDEFLENHVVEIELFHYLKLATSSIEQSDHCFAFLFRNWYAVTGKVVYTGIRFFCNEGEQCMYLGFILHLFIMTVIGESYSTAPKLDVNDGPFLKKDHTLWSIKFNSLDQLLSFIFLMFSPCFLTVKNFLVFLSYIHIKGEKNNIK